MKDIFDMNAQPGVEVNIMPVVGDTSVSYTHLTLPTKA